MLSYGIINLVVLSRPNTVRKCAYITYTYFYVMEGLASGERYVMTHSVYTFPTGSPLFC